MTNLHFLKTPLVLTLGEMAVAECKEQGVKHCVDATSPNTLITSEGKLRPDIACFQEYIILVPEGGEDIRDTIALHLGDERCKWAYFPEDPRNIPCILGDAKRMWIDEVARLYDIPESGNPKAYETGFKELDDWGLRLVTPAFMPIVGPYGSGKSIFLRQLLFNLWDRHKWKFALTSFEEKVRPRYERDFLRHLIGKPEKMWREDELAKAQKELNEMAVFIRRKRNTLLDVDRLLNRLEYAVRVYGVKVVAIDPFNEIDHLVPRGESKTDYVGSVIMQLKQLADDYNLLMIVLLHPPKDGVEKRLQRHGMLTLNDGADSAHWGNKADIGFCMWRDLNKPTLLHIDKLKDHETMGRPVLCELAHDPSMNSFRVARLGYDNILGDNNAKT